LTLIPIAHENCAERATFSPRWTGRKRFKEQSMIHYIVSSKNGFALAGTLQHFKIPYDFNPFLKWRKKRVKNGYGKDVWEFDLCTESDAIMKTKSGEITLADIMFYMYEHFGENTDMEIIHQHEYNG